MKYVVVLLIFISLLTTFLFAQELHLGELENINNLGIDDKTTSFSTGQFSTKITMIVDVSNAKMYKKGKGFDILHIQDLKQTGTQGAPTTYISTKKILLPKYALVTGIRLIDGEYAEIQNEINLAPRPKPMSLFDTESSELDLIKDASVYNKNELFPGKIVSYISGEDTYNTVAYIQFYPVQYNPANKKTNLITTATFEIFYNLEEHTHIQNFSTRTDAENIIITSTAFLSHAQNLEILHETLENVSTEIITTQWINSNYSPVEGPVQAGYANISGSPVSDDYDYELAKKIIAYLRHESAHPNLKSITLFGDALIVPPSYYFYIPYHTSSNNWIVSDIFYASPDYDLIMNYEIGRLPATNTDEAEWIVDKYEMWKNNLNKDWYDNVQLFGGATFGSRYLMGEIGMVDAVNKDSFYGMNVEKNFHTNGKENRSHLLPHFTDNNTGILFCSGHGSGTSFIMTSSSISSNDLTNMIPTTNPPVLLMIACHNGRFDNELIGSGSYDSFGETCLFADAGSIVFWGSVRPAFVGYDYMFNEDGEMIIAGSTYLSGIMINCVKAYSEGYLSFGEISKKAVEDYVCYLDEENQVDLLTVYEYVFLGDPAFSLLPQTSSNSYEKISMDISPTPPHQGYGFAEPTYFFSPDFTPTITISGQTNSPTVDMSLYKIINGGSVSELVNITSYNPPFEVLFNPDADCMYLTRFDTQDAKETRLYFRTETVANIPPTKPELYDIQCNDGSYDIFWSPSCDYDGGSVSYTLKEMRNPLKVTEECVDLENWDNKGFSVVTGGPTSLYCFNSGGGPDLITSITTIAPILIEENEDLSFWKRHIMEPNWDYAYVEISEDGEEYTVLKTYTGISDSWTHTTINLNAYENQSVYIRFRYKSDFVISGSGFYVDDIYPAHWFEEQNIVSEIPDTTFHIDELSQYDSYYRVKASDGTGLESDWSNIKEIQGSYSIPGSNQFNEPHLWALSQNYPNPFNPITIINYTLPQQAKISLRIFDINGRLAQTLVNEEKGQGHYSVTWNAKNMPPGVYLYKIDTGSYSKVKKMLLFK